MGCQVADDGASLDLAGDEQAAAGLGVGKQERGHLVDQVQAGVRPHPVEVAPAPPLT